MQITKYLCNSIKQTTGIFGIKVEPNARKLLQDTYQQTLTALQSLPSSAIYYKTAVQQLTEQRLNIINSNKSDLEIENEIDCGQLEELLMQAEDELKVIELQKQE